MDNLQPPLAASCGVVLIGSSSDPVKQTEQVSVEIREFSSSASAELGKFLCNQLLAVWLVVGKSVD